MQMFPLAMLPDTIAEDTQITGRRRAGTFTGVWTAGETLGLAVGPALYALVLPGFRSWW
jgi:Na+/melibiose symporter-like transporter